jgi:hypothetical protein
LRSTAIHALAIERRDREHCPRPDGQCWLQSSR